MNLHRIADSEVLTPRQGRAIAALLAASSVREASCQARVSERTLHGWLTQPAFRNALAQASRERLAGAVAILRSSASEAVATLRAALCDASSSTRVRAAVALLDTAVKVEVDDLVRRVEMLEAAQQPGQRR